MPVRKPDSTDETTPDRPAPAPVPAQGEVYSRSEEALVAARLEALGYLE
jgi:hypothetical protein